MNPTIDHLRRLLPRRDDYHELPRSWRADLMAGLTVGIVALPLALGFGISSGVGAEAGLITAIVAGLIAAIFGGSHIQVSGPTGAMVVVLAPIVATYGLGAVATVSVMAGVIVLLAGVLRLGRAVAFIPWPVIEGFTLGIGVIIFTQQIPLLTDPALHGASHTNVMVTAATALGSADGAHLAWALGAVLVVAACMVGLPKLHKAIPGSLVGIVVVTVATLFLDTPLSPIGDLPSSLPAPQLPPMDPTTISHLMLPSLTIAALAAIESLLSARVASSMADTGRYEPERELLGQGLASVAAGLFGGMPATGAIARTAVNIRSGARTRLASITHALVLLVVVLLASGPVEHIPRAALAGVLMVTALRMISLSTAWSILRSTRADALAFVATAVVTVSVDLVVAVVIGLIVAGIFAIRSLSRLSAVHREPLPGEPVAGDERIVLFRLDGPLFFAPADRILAAVTATADVSVVVLRMSQLQLVDATGAHTLVDIVEQLEARGITVLLKGVQDGHTKLFSRIGVLAALRHVNHLFDDLDLAVAHARSHVARQVSPSAN